MAARANIKDVAKLAGVSPGTVSRMLTGNSYVGTETRAKIAAAIEELGYVAATRAKNEKKPRSNMIALVIPSILNPVFPDITQGVETVANDRNYTTILCNTNEDLAKEKEYIDQLLKRSIDGFIFATVREDSHHILKLRERGIPVVLVNRRLNDEVDAVQIDNFKAGFDATSYLISTGRRNVAFGMGDPALRVYRERKEGYLAALEQHGIRFREEWIMQETYGSESFYGLTKLMMASEHTPNAILASTDIKAFTVMRALIDNGYRIPQDVSVMGIDNIATSALLEPPLSSVCQPLAQMGALAARKLISQIEYKDEYGKLMQPVIDTLPTELIIRKSTL